MLYKIVRFALSATRRSLVLLSRISYLFAVKFPTSVYSIATSTVDAQLKFLPSSPVFCPRSCNQACCQATFVFSLSIYFFISFHQPYYSFWLYLFPRTSHLWNTPPTHVGYRSIPRNSLPRKTIPRNSLPRISDLVWVLLLTGSKLT